MVGVVDQSRLGSGPTTPSCHLERVADYLCPDMVVYRPSNHFSVSGVHDHRQIHLSLTGGVLGVGVGPERPSDLFGWWVSPERPPNPTCNFHCIRLSMCSCHCWFSLCLHYTYPPLGLLEVGPRCAGIHQRPPRSTVRLRTHWNPTVSITVLIGPFPLRSSLTFICPSAYRIEFSRECRQQQTMQL